MYEDDGSYRKSLLGHVFGIYPGAMRTARVTSDITSKDFETRRWIPPPGRPHR
jgi:hypothetical protein